MEPKKADCERRLETPAQAGGATPFNASNQARKHAGVLASFACSESVRRYRSGSCSLLCFAHARHVLSPSGRELERGRVLSHSRKISTAPRAKFHDKASTCAEVLIAIISNLKQTFYFRDDSVSRRQERVRENKMFAFAFTLAELLCSEKLYSCAFTLAEVLIVLGIIGLVADMTIPTLINSTDKKVTVTRLQKTYSALQQAITLSEVNNGQVNNWDFGSGYTKTDVKKFLDVYILPYLRVTANDTTIDDGGSPVNGYESNRTVLADGTVLSFSLDGDNAAGLPPRSLLISVDINGDKKPNVVGKDKFAMSVHPVDKPSIRFFCWQSGSARCTVGGINREEIIDSSPYGCKKSINKRLNCGALIQYDNWTIKDDYPW